MKSARDAHGKTVYLTYIFHGNMDYDRYGKAVIRRAFPEIYRMVSDEFLRFPELKAQVELSGVTMESLRIWAPDVLETLKELRRRGQVAFTGSYYAAPVNVCVDGETDLASAVLGCEVARDIVGDIDGFFSQEEAYHPQLPLVLKKAGVNWVTVTPDLEYKNPFKLVGLDGTAITGIPLTNIDSGNLEERYDAAEPDSLLCSIGDYEMPPSFTALIERICDMRARGKEVEFIFVDEYLKRFGAKGEARYPVCAIFPENTAASPSFSRWTSDPWDIAVHHESVKAMRSLKTAEAVDAALAADLRMRMDLPLSDVDVCLPLDPRAWAIENPGEFTELESRRFAQPLSALDRARHLLLWAVNSDARGWYPMLEKRYERINSLKGCAALATGISLKGLLAAAQNRLKTTEGTASGGAVGALVVHNPGEACTDLIEVRGQAPLGAPAESSFDGSSYISRLKADFPAYSITAIPISASAKGAPEARWREGHSAGNGELRLTAKDDGVEITGSATRGSKLMLSLHLPEIRELGKDPMPSSRAFSGPTLSHVRDFAVPELTVYRQLDWCIHFTQTYKLLDDFVLCDWQFDFTKPMLIGRLDNGQFDPDGIRADISGPSLANGDVWYDSPFAVPMHGGRSAGYITAFTFAILQTALGGVAVTSTAGAQSFRADAMDGRIGFCMGCSTVGAPAKPSDMAVDREHRSFEHFDTWDREVFFGSYSHSFAVRPFAGTWQDAGIPAWASSRTAPLVHTMVSEELSGSFKLFTLTGDGVKLTSLRIRDGVLVARLVELFGRETQATLEVGRKRVSLKMRPYSIEEVVMQEI